MLKKFALICAFITPLQAQYAHNNQITGTDILKFTGYFFGATIAISSIWALTITAIEQGHPEYALGIWGFAITAGLIAKKLSDRAFERRTDSVVLQEAQRLLQSGISGFTSLIEIAEKIKTDSTEDQRIAQQYQLIKALRGMGYKRAVLYHAIVTDHFNELVNAQLELQKRIIKLNFQEANAETEKLLKLCQKTDEEITSWKRRLLILMTAVTNIPSLVYSGDLAAHPHVQ